MRQREDPALWPSQWEESMPRIRLDEDLRPVTEFRANSAALIKQVRDTKRPVVLTQRGRGAAVLVNVEEYQRMIDVLEAAREGASTAAGAVSTLTASAPATPHAETGAPTPITEHPRSALVEVYKEGVDRSLIRENLSRPAGERLRRLTELGEFSESLRAAPRRPATPPADAPDSPPDPTPS